MREAAVTETQPVPVDVDDDLVDPGPPHVPGWAILAVLLAILVVLLLLRGAGVGYDFKIKLRGRDVSVSGKRITAGLRSSLIQFFENDFPLKTRLTIYGRRRANRTYDLRFHGRVTAGEKQQVRNFLTSGV